VELLSEKFKEKVDFVTIYITEAHALDDWHMDHETIDYNQPKTLDERKACCQKLVDLYNPKMTIVLDEMSNACQKAFNALPERLYISLNEKIVYQGGIGPMDYKIEEVENWLKKNDY
jgi:hypothetical protein